MIIFYVFYILVEYYVNKYGVECFNRDKKMSFDFILGGSIRVLVLFYIWNKLLCKIIIGVLLGNSDIV